MTDRQLIDTNILVYAYDHSEPEKQEKAVEILNNVVEEGSGVISTQVLSEFFVASTKKIPSPLTLREASERVENFISIWPVIEITPLIIIEAMRGARQYTLSFWDSLIWATARLNQIRIVLSEDFNAGQTLEGIRFVNPLKTGK